MGRSSPGAPLFLSPSLSFSVCLSLPYVKDRDLPPSLFATAASMRAIADTAIATNLSLLYVRDRSYDKSKYNAISNWYLDSAFAYMLTTYYLCISVYAFYLNLIRFHFIHLFSFAHSILFHFVPFSFSLLYSVFLTYEDTYFISFIMLLSRSVRHRLVSFV